MSHFQTPKLSEQEQAMHLSTFLSEARRVVDDIRIKNIQDYEIYSKRLLYDDDSNTYPYIVILLMMRFGFVESVKSYCSHHQKQEIKEFGKFF